MKLFGFGGDSPFWSATAADQVAAVVERFAPVAEGRPVDVSVREIAVASVRLPTPGDGNGPDPALAFGACVPTRLLTVRVPDGREGADDIAGALGAFSDVAPGGHVFAVVERVAFAGTGSPVPSMSRIGLLWRPSDRTVEDFWSHWMGHHVPLVLSRHPLFARYVPNLVLRPAQPFDGVVEQWFVDEATWQEHDRQIREEKPDIAADIPRFIGGIVQFSGIELTSAHG